MIVVAVFIVFVALVALLSWRAPRWRVQIGSCCAARPWPPTDLTDPDPRSDAGASGRGVEDKHVAPPARRGDAVGSGRELVLVGVGHCSRRPWDAQGCGSDRGAGGRDKRRSDERGAIAVGQRPGVTEGVGAAR